MLYLIFVSTDTMHKVPYSMRRMMRVGSELDRYLELSNQVESNSSHHVAIIYWESDDSCLPNKVGIKPYHHGKVIDN